MQEVSRANGRNNTQHHLLLVGLLVCMPVGFAVSKGNDPPRQSPPAVERTAVRGEKLTQRGERNWQRSGEGFWGRWWRGSTAHQKNHMDVKSAYERGAKSAAKMVGRITAGDRTVALATVVDADGYLVTKASLLEKGKQHTCQFSGRESVAVAVIGVDEDFDLALLKADGLDLSPVSWRAEAAGPGTFVAAVDSDGEVISMGVISTEPRRIVGTRQRKPPRAWLGVTLGGGEAGTSIVEVLPRSAAQRAGLKSGDSIKALDGVDMPSMEKIIATVGNHKPGDKVAVLVRRDGEMLEFSATLGTPTQPLSPHDQWGGGPFSARRDAFPEVIAHDTIVRPEHCGGPLIDIDGNIVGVNIARALRVTTYAVPAATILRLVNELKKS